jgi:hypothetical protein
MVVLVAGPLRMLTAPELATTTFPPWARAGVAAPDVKAKSMDSDRLIKLTKAILRRKRAMGVPS